MPRGLRGWVIWTVDQRPCWTVERRNHVTWSKRVGATHRLDSLFQSEMGVTRKHGLFEYVMVVLPTTNEWKKNFSIPSVHIYPLLLRQVPCRIEFILHEQILHSVLVFITKGYFGCFIICLWLSLIRVTPVGRPDSNTLRLRSNNREQSVDFRNVNTVDSFICHNQTVGMSPHTG